MVFFAILILYILVALFLLVPMNKVNMAAIMLVFVFLFSTVISLLPDARMIDIFVGSVAYIAVLVTFLGNLQGMAGCANSGE